MDIKDFILIGGALLIAAVVAHGFWIAWRARRDPLRIDLVTDLPPSGDEDDDLRRLRAELPNGGGRPAGDRSPSQRALDLDNDSRPVPAAREPGPDGAPSARGRTEPRLSPSPDEAQQVDSNEAPYASTEAPSSGSEDAPETAPASTEAPAADVRPAAPAAVRRDKVKDVIMPERPKDRPEPRESRRWTARKDTGGRREPPQGRPAGVKRPESAGTEQPVDELVIINLLAPKGEPFVGPAMVESLRARGLRYGRMNIFHRVDPMTKASLYSVANVVEPGTFDMADLEGFRSPGVCFFLQLPGPERPMETFEDMLKVARDVSARVGGSLFDEQRSVLTGQTVEHYRQRITDFCRRRMSMRA